MSASKSNRNYYEVLHVSRDAPRAIIQGSYRTLMQKLKHHPDLGGDADTAAQINKAYQVLNDPESRKAYDARLDILDQVGAAFSAEESNPPPKDEARAASPEQPGRQDQTLPNCAFCKAPQKPGAIIEDEAVCATCGSPLCAARSIRHEAQGQRAITRMENQKSLKFYTEWPLGTAGEGETRDISLSGLRFVTRQTLHEGQCIKLISPILEAVATVTHCSRERRDWTTQCTVGVSFITLRFVNSIGGFVSDQV